MKLGHKRYESCKDLYGITDRKLIVKELSKMKTYLHAEDKSNLLPLYDVSLEEINSEFRYWREIKPELLFENDLTPSKQFSKRNFNYGVWYVLNNQFFKLFVSCIDSDGVPCAYQLRFRINDTGINSEITGRDSFQKFRAELKKDGVNIEDFAIPNGKELKMCADFGKPAIEFNTAIRDKTIENAHHVDISSAYMYYAGVYHSEWMPTIEKIFEKRKTNSIYKHLLTHCCGFFQSQYCVLNGHGYALADVASYAIRETAFAVKKMGKALQNYGFKVLAYNTDGVWFSGDLKRFPSDELRKLYQEKEIGKFSIDHENCTIRFKSVGAYEYIENGEYTPVVRGLTRFDRAGLPRKDWKWGYIYMPEGEQVEIYRFDKNIGLERKYITI